jgi:L-cysteine/cystine lyase
MPADTLRAAFPVCARLAYLNAGTDGPLAAAAAAAARAELERAVRDGRAGPHFERRFALQAELRAGYARWLGADPADVALTTSTSEGLGLVLLGIALRPGQEVLTATGEHPGLLGALQAARDLRGVTVRAVPLAELPDAVGPGTALVACSHVAWRTGERAPVEALAALDVPVVYDGAQGVGAVPVDVRALGCAAYAGAGQKWLCGPDGLGMLYVAPEHRDGIAAVQRSYTSFADAGAGLDAALQPDARRYDTAALSAEALGLAVAALAVLEEHGRERVLREAAERAAALAAALAERGRTVAPRGDTTLVSWEDPDPPASRQRLLDAGIVVRDLPGTPWLRASVGAWNGEEDLERLLAAA